jgi:hypothetical protein
MIRNRLVKSRFLREQLIRTVDVIVDMMILVEILMLIMRITPLLHNIREESRMVLGDTQRVSDFIEFQHQSTIKFDKIFLYHVPPKLEAFWYSESKFYEKKLNKKSYIGFSILF